ncbi:MAG: HEAT repeat domain-containing protein, partial [Candidatus Latescibacterota bacterium]
RVLHGIVDGLIAVLRSGDMALKGDTADLLGTIGHPHAAEPLQELLQSDNADIVEIAEEALQNLREEDA